LREKTQIVSKNKTNLKVSKVKLTITVSLILKCVLLGLFWSEYSKIAPNPYQIWGADEAHWFRLGERIENSIGNFGFFHCFLDLENITGTYHHGWPFIVGVCFFLFGKNVFYVLVAKQVFYAVSCYYLYKLSRMINYSHRVSYYVMAFAILYPPMLINSFSLMREEIIFGLITIILYNLYKIKSKRSSLYFTHLLTISIILFTFTIRIHVGAILACMYILFAFLKSTPAKQVILFVSLPVAAFLLLEKYIDYILNFFFATKGSLSVYQILLSYTRFLLSPLPWRILPEVHHIYVAWWYYISLPVILLSSFFFLKIFISIKRHWQIFLFIFLYFLSYVFNAALFADSRMSVGPRQFCVIGPLLFLVCFSNIIDNIVIRYNFKKFIK
jgi:hypothetical protein